MEISEENLQTIEKYALFQHLIDSNGIVDESVLDKLKLNIRSLITSEVGNNKELLEDVYKRQVLPFPVWYVPNR